MASTRGGGEYQLAVEPDALFTAADRLKAIADELKNSHDHTAAQVKNVLGAAWRGQTADAFTSDWEEFDRAARDICEDAATIASLVEYAGQTYIEMDDNNAATVRAVYPKDL
jgi:WXG100 family type VII secretion target